MATRLTLSENIFIQWEGLDWNIRLFFYLSKRIASSVTECSRSFHLNILILNSFCPFSVIHFNTWIVIIKLASKKSYLSSSKHSLILFWCDSMSWCSLVSCWSRLVSFNLYIIRAYRVYGKWRCGLKDRAPASI